MGKGLRCIRPLIMVSIQGFYPLNPPIVGYCVHTNLDRLRFKGFRPHSFLILAPNFGGL
jgi:hypothetical protein